MELRMISFLVELRDGPSAGKKGAVVPELERGL